MCVQFQLFNRHKNNSHRNLTKANIYQDNQIHMILSTKLICKNKIKQNVPDRDRATQDRITQHKVEHDKFLCY